MTLPKIIAIFDKDQRYDIVYPDLRREVMPNVVRHINISDTWEGAIIHSRLDETNADAEIEAQIDYFESIGQSFEWKIYDYDTPHDLKERLVAHGFEIEAEEAVLVLDLADAPEKFWQPITHDVRKITSPDKVSDVVTVHEQVWEETQPWLTQYLTESLANYPDKMSIYAAYVNEKPVCAAWIYFAEGSQFGGLWGGSTLEAYRGQGIYTAVVAARAQEAKARGIKYLTVDTTPMSRPILEKRGFKTIARSFPCKWTHPKRK